MLNEQRRTQLDNIVQQMTINQESDTNVQSVVNDFKQKYEAEKKQKGLFEKVGKGVGKFVGDVTGITGIAKGVGEAGKVAKGLITGKEYAPQVSPAQFAGSVGKAGLTAATFLAPPIASTLALRGGLAVGAKVAEGGVIGALFKATDNLEKQKPIGEKVGTAAIIGGAIPLAGAGLTGLKKLVGKTGEKIQYSVIKPNASDIRDGFKIETINKYGLGGSLGQMAHKTQDTLDDLTKQLQSKVKRTDVAVDLNDIYARTTKKLVGDKAKSFGNIAPIRRVLQNLQGEIDEVSGNGLVDLAESQVIKQSSGLKGSWVFGSADPDATAVERVYTAFYRELKEEIEKKAPAGVSQINQQISDLIPVMNAIIRRIPIAERNNVLSLTDVISLGMTAIHPSGAALLAVNKLSKSGRVGAFLAGVRPKEPTTKVGKRLFGF